MNERDEKLMRDEEQPAFDTSQTGFTSGEHDISHEVSNTSGRDDLSFAGQSPTAVDQHEHASGESCDCPEQMIQQGRDFISESSEQVAQTLGRVSQCLRETSQQAEHDHPVFGKYVRSAAESMEKFSDSLRHKDMDFFVNQTESLARHQPGIFLGSAFTMGFALGRFLKGKSKQSVSNFMHEHDLDRGMDDHTDFQTDHHSESEDMASMHVSERSDEPEIWH